MWRRQHGGSVGSGSVAVAAWRWQRGGGSMAAAAASLVAEAARRKHVVGSSVSRPEHFLFRRMLGMRRGVVAEVRSFRCDIFSASTRNFFLDAHGRGQDAIVVFGKNRVRKLRTMKFFFYLFIGELSIPRLLTHLVPYLQIQCMLVNELTSMTPKSNNTCRKLRVSAFKRY